MGDHFSFKWTDFRSSLTQGFHDFLQEEMMVDVTLAAEGKFIQAHKLVLSVCSPHFKTLFKVNPCKHPIVILQDIGYSELSYMLEFMYKGEVKVRHENLKSFLKLAETLKVRGLAGKHYEIDFDSSAPKVKNKLSKDEIPKDGSHSESFSDESDKKPFRKRRKRLHKLDSIKKIKSENSEKVSVNIITEDNNISVSEDEDDNPLISLIKGEKVKSGENSKQSESDEKNNVSFSDWDDAVEPNDYSENAEDFETFFPTVNQDDSEQAPQDALFNGVNLLTINKRVNPVWDYFQLDGEKAICKLCNKRLAYKNHMYLTSLSNHLASKRYGHHQHYLEYVSKKNEIFKETDAFYNLTLRMASRDGPDLTILRHHLQ